MNKILEQRLKYCLRMYLKNPSSTYFVPLAETYLELNLLDEAIEVLQNGLKWHPTYFIGRALLSKAYFKKEHFTQSFMEAQKVAAVSPINILALKMCVASALKLNEIEKTKYFLDQLLKLVPNDQETLKWKAHIHGTLDVVDSDIKDFQVVDFYAHPKLKLLQQLLERVRKHV